MSKSVMLGSERELEAGKKDVVRCTFLRRQKKGGATPRGNQKRAERSGRERKGAGGVP